MLIVAGAPAAAPPTAGAVEALLRDLLAGGLSPSQAAREAAQQTGLPRRDLYDLARTLSSGT